MSPPLRDVVSSAAAARPLIGWVLCAALGCGATNPPAHPLHQPPATPPVAAVAAPAVAVPVPPPQPQPQPPSCPTMEVAWPTLNIDAAPPVPPLVRPETLAPFFDKVARLLRGKAKDHIRIAVYGDSNLTMDFTTGQMRRVLQQRFGDAGHGFVALARPWSHYQHMDVRHGVRGSIESFACSTHPAYDQLYGISCIAGESRARGASAWVASAQEGAPIGRAVDHIEVFYARSKRFGRFVIEVDGEVVAEPNSHQQQVALGHWQLDVPDGAHELRVVASDEKRPARWLGAVFERKGQPSFVIDSFGVGAMNTPSQARQSPVVSVPMLRARHYDLIIFATGANDGFSMHKVERDLTTMINMQRQALPNTPIVLLTPTDRGKKRTFRKTYQVVQQRRQLAEKWHIALWDMFAAMGGKNSMRGFKKRGLAKFDYIHLTRAGGAYLGERLLHALWTALAQHLKQHPHAGCDG